MCCEVTVFDIVTAIIMTITAILSTTMVAIYLKREYWDTSDYDTPGELFEDLFQKVKDRVSDWFFRL